MNINTAPFPVELEELISTMQYRPGWTFVLKDIDRDEGQKDDNGELTPVEIHCIGLTLVITTLGLNSYHVDRGPSYSVHHYMPVPAATYNRGSWRRWLFDQCLIVDRHEGCEFFVVEGEHFYAPHHGPGNDPYIVFDHGDDLDRRTSFRGVVT